MKRLWLTKLGRLAGLIALVSTTVLVTNGGVTTAPAGADPAFTSSYVGVGSDTIQDVLNALGGASPYPGPGGTNSTYYLPIHSSVASGSKSLSSFDAIPQGGSASAPGCITSKLGGPSYDRPNGSSNGIAALSHAVDPTPANNVWQASTASCTGAPINVAGQIDFARSSRGPKTQVTNALTYIPFAGDGVTYAYIQHGTQDITHLTTAQLTALYNGGTGTISVGGDTVRACLAQTGSGTVSFFLGAIGDTVANATTSATNSGCFTAPGLEENGADAFLAKANSINVTDDYVIMFSAGSWISQANGVAPDRSGVGRAGGVDLGNPDNLAGAPPAKPYLGAPPTETPNPTYYNNPGTGVTVGTYRRNLYIVVSTPRIGLTGDAGLKSLFVGASAKICDTGGVNPPAAGTAQDTVQKFGFLTMNGAFGNCGDTTLTGDLYS
jgi:hypothetical protein